MKYKQLISKGTNCIRKEHFKINGIHEAYNDRWQGRNISKKPSADVFVCSPACLSARLPAWLSEEERVCTCVPAREKPFIQRERRQRWNNLLTDQGCGSEGEIKKSHSLPTGPNRPLSSNYKVVPGPSECSLWGWHSAWMATNIRHYQVNTRLGQNANVHRPWEESICTWQAPPATRQN